MKNVDDEYKKRVVKEKQEGEEDPTESASQAAILFSSLIMSLSVEVLRALGDIKEEEGQGKPDKDKARYFIDTVAILEEKTKGNVTQEEKQLLEATLYELRLAYARKVME